MQTIVLSETSQPQRGHWQVSSRLCGASELSFWRLSCCCNLESESWRTVSRFYLEDLFLSKKLPCAAAVGIGCLPIHSDRVLLVRKLGGRNLDALPHRSDIKVHRYGFL